MFNNYKTKNELEPCTPREAEWLESDQAPFEAAELDDLKEVALEYRAAGLSVVPLKEDKRPKLGSWKPYQSHIATESEIKGWQFTPGGIGIICGTVSGGLEVIDVDEKYNVAPMPLLDTFKGLVEKQRPGLFEKLVVESTQNGGQHLIYRCKKFAGSEKLAQRGATEEELAKNSKQGSLTLIETRGEGGYIMCAPSDGYELISGSFDEIPLLTEEEREILFACAYSMNSYFAPGDIVSGLAKGSNSKNQNRPGDEFNERGTVHDLLEKAGWTKSGESELQEFWVRPGKDSGISATFHKELKLFYVFSSNADPFVANKAYSKFAVYVMLAHGGDFQSATKALVRDGYGKALQKKDQYDIEKVEEFLTDKYEFRYNAVLQRVEFQPQGSGPFRIISDYDLHSMFRELQHNGLPVGVDTLHRIIESDFSPAVDPFVEYFSNLPAWDGITDHIEALAKTITLKNDDEQMEFQNCLRKWLIGQVACAINPREPNHTAIILVGGQGDGKTTWLNQLIPSSLADYRFVGTINPDSKDTLLYLSEKMLINLDELETLRKAEIGSLKSLMTMKEVNARRPYGRFSAVTPRRASFVGSINNSEFLNDATGTRRFLVFEVKGIEYLHGIDMNLVYAQAYTLHKNGVRSWFDSAEIMAISERNKKYSVKTMEHEMLIERFQPGDSNNPESKWGTSTNIAKAILDYLGSGLHLQHIRLDDKVVQNFGRALTAENYPFKKVHGTKLYYYQIRRAETGVGTRPAVHPDGA